MQTKSTLSARISPQWLSELRRLWPNVFCQVASEFVSGSVPTLCLDSGIVTPLRLCWVKDVCLFRCNLPPALLAKWPGSFTCHCGNTGVEQTPNESQHTKLTLEKKILTQLLPGFELATFRSRGVRRSWPTSHPGTCTDQTRIPSHRGIQGNEEVDRDGEGWVQERNQKKTRSQTEMRLIITSLQVTECHTHETATIYCWGQTRWSVTFRLRTGRNHTNQLSGI